MGRQTVSGSQSLSSTLQTSAAFSLGGQHGRVASWKIRTANVHLLERFSSYLGLDFSRIKSRPDFEQLYNYGTIAM